MVMLDADGEALGVYRKSHIPDGPGYHEKYYFNPGDTGFKVWNTRYAKIGVAKAEYFPTLSLTVRGITLIAKWRGRVACLAL